MANSYSSILRNPVVVMSTSHGHENDVAGLSNAMLLPSVTKFSIDGSPLRYSECAKAMGIAFDNDNQDEETEERLIIWAELITEEFNG